MSHYTTKAGRPYVECDSAIRDIPANGALRRCGQRSYGVRDRFGDGPELGILDLLPGWSTAPYPDDFDHGATRTNLLDGSPIEPWPELADSGILGDLHTCPTCNRRRRVAR